MLIVTVLLAYRPVIGSGRRGGALLGGLAAGAVLVGALAVAVPASVGPLGWVTLAGSAAVDDTDSVPTATPTARPGRTTVDLSTVPRESAEPPTTTAAPEPPATTTSRRKPPAPADPAAAVVAATNAERQDAGCPALDTDRRLARAAQGHASDMAEDDFFSHTGEDGEEFVDRIRDTGHPSPGAENIAQGQSSAAEVVAAWMDSSGHRKNILNCSFTDIGVGYDERGDYWVQDFGR